VLLIFDGGKSARPTAVPLFSRPVFDLHLRVEFKEGYRGLNMKQDKTTEGFSLNSMYRAVKMFEGNKICRLLNIKYPIIQGGMAWASDSNLACAVSGAGGLGIIGCGGRELGWAVNEIDKAKKISTHRIGLNVALRDSNAVNIVEIAIANGIKVFTMGGANVYLKLIPKYGEDVLIVPLVGSVMEAKLAERAGAKVIICEGQESGGSIGRLSLFSLLPQVVDAVKIPVIAAGGIADSRGMCATFALGAQGIQIGTRFLASEECCVSDEYKKRILKARDTDSMVIGRKINSPTRVIKNKFAVDYVSKERNETSQGELLAMSRGRLKLAAKLDVDTGALHAGEIAGLICDIKSARDIIEGIVLGFAKDVFEGYDDNSAPDERISRYLRHKPPILLVDKVLDLKPGIESRTSLKLSEDKWFFNCHYPDYPVMPGSLLFEAMSQTMTLVVTSMDKFNEEWGGVLLLSGISNAKFSREALPGVELIMSAKIDSFKRGIVKGNIRCEADGELICTCEMTIVIPNAIKQFSNLMKGDK
jgi:enoyl-[acyl-carrier protein] reductase II